MIIIIKEDIKSISLLIFPVYRRAKEAAEEVRVLVLGFGFGFGNKEEISVSLSLFSSD